MQMYLTTPPTFVQVNDPPSIAGNYIAGSATYGPQTFSVTGELVLTIPALGCSAITNEVAGKIAVIDRGNCTFVEKTQFAQNAGAIGVIIVNNQTGPPPNLGGNSSSISIPTLSISLSDGNKIRDVYYEGNTITATLVSFIF